MYIKNTASQNLPFVLINASTGAALTGATVTAYRSIDGGAQGSCTGSVSEKANGQYSLALSQADTNGDTVGYLFTASSAIPVHITVSFMAAVNLPANVTQSDGVSLATHASGMIPSDTRDYLGSAAPALQGGRYDSSVGAYQSGLTPLQPTAAGRTLDVTATGEAGVDWANVGGASTTVNLSGTTVKAVTDDVGISQAAADKVWGTTVRTLSSFGTLVADIATAVWTATARTLTAFGFSVSTASDANVAAIKAKTDNLPTDPADASDIAASFGTVTSTLATIAGYIDTEVGAIKAKTDNLPASPAAVGSAMTLTAAYDAAKTTSQPGDAMTLTAAYDPAKTAAQPGDAMTLTAEYDAAKTAAQASDIPAADIADIKAKTDNLPADPAAAGDIPTAAENADQLLGRSIAGGADGGRTVTSALRALRNKTAIAGGTLTVTQEDDSTTDWTATLTTDAAAEPVTSIDPV